MASPCIPFNEPLAGGGGNRVDPNQMASWVKEQDRVPLALAISLYSPPPTEQLGDFKLVPGSFRVRVAAWFNENTGECVIGCRGTSVAMKEGKTDLADDKVRL